MLWLRHWFFSFQSLQWSRWGQNPDFWHFSRAAKFATLIGLDSEIWRSLPITGRVAASVEKCQYFGFCPHRVSNRKENFNNNSPEIIELFWGCRFTGCSTWRFFVEGMERRSRSLLWLLAFPTRWNVPISCVPCAIVVWRSPSAPPCPTRPIGPRSALVLLSTPHKAPREDSYPNEDCMSVVIDL